jgi:hypothetical protein
MAEQTEKPEPHYVVRVVVERVVPAHLTKERYNSTAPVRVERSVSELLGVTSRDTDELEAVLDAIAYLEVRKAKIELDRVKAAQRESDLEKAERGTNRVYPIQDRPQA